MSPPSDEAIAGLMNFEHLILFWEPEKMMSKKTSWVREYRKTNLPVRAIASDWMRVFA